jgi:CubicO group peptidase (beta-lactamase class C family)
MASHSNQVGIGVVCVLLCTLPATAEDALDAAVVQELHNGMFLGAVVMAGRTDEPFLCRAYGQRDVGQPMTTDSLFDIASVTKVVTVATALAMTLQEHPDIALDDRIQKYLAAMRGKDAEQVTIRALAQHRSGLDNTKELCAKYAGEELVQHILARDNSWPVDARWEYSCLGMIRLGEMIAAIEHMPFGDYCQTRIFAPLGMTDTYFVTVPPDQRARCVATCGPCGMVEDMNARKIGRPVGNAGVFTTARDLARVAVLWLQQGTFAGRRFFAPAIGREFAGNAIVWQRQNVNQLPANAGPGTYFHTGYTGQTLLIDPEHDVYIAILTAWSHPAIKVSADSARRARASIARVIIDHYLPSTGAQATP